LRFPAGSDLYRLAQLRSRRSAYAEVVRSADGIVTTRSAATALMALGAPIQHSIFDRPVLAPRALFAEPAPPLPRAPGAQTRAAGPVIGMYGKLGRSKGTPELLAAAARLRDGGLACSVLLMTGIGGAKYAEAAATVRRLRLENTVAMIASLPHWRVPEFLASCDCVCFLENRFAIDVHRPQVPREVATAGRTLSRWPSEQDCLRWTQRLIAICEDLASTQRGARLSLESFQNTLLSIYADPRHRAELLHDPATVGDHVDLTEAERRSLRRLLEQPRLSGATAGA